MSLFQFHKGTIKTLKNAQAILAHANFNSIKVRLRLKDDKDDKIYKPYFNSIKVRLRQTNRFR